MSNAEQIRTRMWAISAAMIGGFFAYLFFSGTAIYLSPVVYLLLRLPHSPMVVAMAGYGLVALVPVAGCIALFRGKDWGRSMIQHIAAAGLVLTCVALVLPLALDMTGARAEDYMSGFWPHADYIELQKYRLYHLGLPSAISIAQIVYACLLYRRMAASPQNPPDDTTASDTRHAVIDPTDARRLYWAVTALLIGCLFICLETGTSFRLTIKHGHGPLTSHPVFQSEWHGDYSLLEQYSSHSFTLAIELIVFTVIHFSQSILGIALIIGAIGVIKQREWGHTFLVGVGIAGIIQAVLGTTVVWSLSHDPQLNALSSDVIESLPYYIARIFNNSLSITMGRTICSGILWSAYFALLFRILRDKTEAPPTETQSMPA